MYSALDHIAPMETDEEIKVESSITLVSLLVYGHIRKIQLHNIIPDDIYGLCLFFYQIKQPIVFWKSHKRLFRRFTQPEAEESRQFGILDMENKSSKYITLQQFQSFDNSKNLDPQCYIPKIKNKALTDGQTLNGIFMVEKQSHYYLDDSEFSS